MAKVKIKQEGFTYIVKSKSLPAAMNRAMLIAEVLGQDEIEYINTTKVNSNGDYTKKWRVTIKVW